MSNGEGELLRNPTFHYETELGLSGQLTPDAVVIYPEKVLVVETKLALSHWAWFALREMYGPILRCYSKQALGGKPVAELVVSCYEFDDLSQIPDLPYELNDIRLAGRTGWWFYRLRPEPEMFDYYRELEQ